MINGVMRGTDLTCETLCALFRAEGIDAEMDEDGSVLVPELEPPVVVSVVELPDRGVKMIHFETSFQMRVIAEEDDRFALCNRINDGQFFIRAASSGPGSLTLSCELPVSDAVPEQTLLMTLGGFAFHANSVHEYDLDDLLRPLERINR